MVEESAGSTALDRVGGLLRKAPVAAAMFGLAALSLAGIPPFSGFVGKLSLVEAGFGSGDYVIIAVSLVGSVLTLFSMAKIWNGVFLGTADVPTPAMKSPHRLQVPALMTTATVALVAVTLAIALFAGPIYDLCHRASESLLDPEAYIRAVLGS
jgi:multicomponent Na+:H+ antiporter subunit D